MFKKDWVMSITIIFSLLLISLVFPGCSKDENISTFENSQEDILQPGWLVLEETRNSNSPSRSGEVLLTSATNTLTGSSTNVFTSTVAALATYTGKTLRIEIQVTAGSAGNISLMQGLSGGTATTALIESNDWTTSNIRTLYLSPSRLATNATNAYIRMYKSGTANVTATVRVYVSSDSYILQKWTVLKDYIHFKQGGNTTIGATACGHNTYMIARHMAKTTFAVNSSNITALHTRLKALPTSSYSNFAYLHYLEGLANGRLYNFSGYQDGLCGGPSTNGRRGDLGRENVTENQRG